MTSAQRILVAITGLLVLTFLAVQIASDDASQAEEPVAPLRVHESPQRSSTAQGHPELFVEVHHDIRASEDGKVDYPMGYRIHEYRKALAARKSAGTTLNWVERGPGNVGGRTRAILVDPDDPDMHTWFVGTAGGGLWWTQNRGYSWGYLTDNLPGLAVTTIAMAESNHDILYIGTGEGFGNLDAAGGSGIFKSYDRGQSWEHLLSTANDTLFRFVNRLAVDPTDANVVVAATNEGIYRTTDGGLLWTEAYASESRIQDLQAQPGNFSTLIASQNPGGILRSMDGGATWTRAIPTSEIVGGGQRIELAYSPSNPAIAYASVQQGAESALLRSDNGGATWANTRGVGYRGQLNWLAGLGWYSNSVAVHPFAPDTVFLGGILLWRSMMTGDVVDVSEVSNFQFSLPSQNDGIVFYIAGLGNALSGLVVVGSIDPTSFSDIEEADYTSVGVRFGQGTQLAHRFTSIDSTLQDISCFLDPATGVPVPYSRNEYQDYVEVPFTVWDSGSGRQLAASFRDSARDSTFNLIPFNITGPCDGVSNEQLFIHKYDYDAMAPHDSLAQDAGLTRGMMYMILPTLTTGSTATWDPDNLPEQTTRITYRRLSGLRTRTVDGNLDPTVDTHVDHHGIVPLVADPGSSDFWVLNSNDGGVSISTDGGDSFLDTDFRFAGFNTSQFYGADKAPGIARYVGGTQDNGSWVSYGNANNRRGWINIPPSGDGFDAIWHNKDPEKIISSSQFNLVAYTTDGGANWDLNFNAFFGDPGLFVTSLDHSPHAPDTVYMMGRVGVWVSPDFGETFNVTTIDSAYAPTNIGKVRASLATDTVVWAGFGLDDRPARTLWYSTNAGESFSPSALPTFPNAPQTIISGLATHPAEVGTAYALFSRSKRPKILQTTDFGQNWQDISGFSESTNGASTRGFPDVAVYDLLVMPHAPNVMWAATDIGLFQTKSYGNEWNYAHNGLPAVSVFRLKYRDDEIVAATHGRGVWTVPWAEIDVSIESDDFSELPKSFSLEPNYPNPFNPTTTITFSVPEEARVRLTVFDVIGRRIAVLTDQAYSAGVHELNWDASAHASGIYFYRMEAAGKLIQTQKMTLVK